MCDSKEIGLSRTLLFYLNLNFLEVAKGSTLKNNSTKETPFIVLSANIRVNVKITGSRIKLS